MGQSGLVLAPRGRAAECHVEGPTGFSTGLLPVCLFVLVFLAI